MSNTGDVPNKRERIISEISFRDASAKDIDTQFTVRSSESNAEKLSVFCPLMLL